MIDQPEGPLDLHPCLGRKAGSFQTDRIDPGNQTRTVGGNEWGDILVESLPSPDHAEASDTDELMEDGTASENGAFLDLDMPGQQAVVGDHDLVGDRRVMTHVRADHQEVPVADNRVRAFGRAPVNRDVLTEGIVVTDHNATAGPGLEGEILRFGTDDGAISDSVPLPQGHDSVQDGPRQDPASGTDPDTRSDDHSGAHLDIGGEDCVGINEGGGVNGWHLGQIMKDDG